MSIKEDEIEKAVTSINNAIIKMLGENKLLASQDNRIKVALAILREKDLEGQTEEQKVQKVIDKLKGKLE